MFERPSSARLAQRAAYALLAFVFVAALSACGETKAVYPDKQRGDTSPTWGDQKRETIFGDGGLFNTDRKKRTDGEGVGIGVNAFLWRAALDTFAFMPLSSADPFGGVIITDWYQPPETPNERFKSNIYILDKVLRADGVKVALFRQVKDGSGNWSDIQVDAKTIVDLENSILTRARQLRTASQEAK
ncbi:MAG: DUF3576 domain-containing protein [Alphaproteobacteria bacterium]|nr:DUF3576 domain-containing protein [Alphaproteobacteria bacterium]